jgi:hypothetical protein
MTVPICVAGMHRSGTSLVAHLLQVCGLYLGDERDLVPASRANPDGYWEHRRFVGINEELLAILGGDWDTPAAIPEPASLQWVENAGLARVRKTAEELCASFDGHGVWGWKDPRNSITLPFWFSQIPDLKVVVCVRHPLEVAASLVRVDPNASIAGGVARWVAYYRRLLADAPPAARILTHAGSYHCEPGAEIRRVAEFAGLTPGPDLVDRGVGIIRPDLRRNRFTGDDVADFDLPADALDLYARMCDEAGWDEVRARAVTSVQSPGGAVGVEEFERLFAARTAHARRLATLDDALVKQQEEIDRRDDDLLWAMQSGITVRGFAREYRRLVEYRRMVRIVRRVLRYVLPPDPSVLVISRGDDELLVGPRAQYFPQGPDGGYAGYHPATSLTAIGHLEALRAKGADFLLIPATELWWLEKYRDFARHLSNRYRKVLEDQWSCTIFALRESGEGPKSVPGQFQELVSACEQVLQREPAILDWGSGWQLATEFPDRTVFGPPADDSVLPYLDRSVDVVALPAGSPERIQEAERVATTAVLILPDRKDSGQQLDVRWTTQQTGHLPSASLIVPDSAVGGSNPMRRSLEEALPSGVEVEVLVENSEAIADGSFSKSCNAAAARASGEILVFLEPSAVVLPDWLTPLLRLLRDRPRAGACGGKVLAPDGLIEYGGGTVADDGALVSVGEVEYAGRGPASEVVRNVEWCSPAFVATRRTLFQELGGFDDRYTSPYYAVADYCLRVQEHGADVLFQPDAAVVRVEPGSSLADPPAAFAARWQRQESMP